MAYTKLKKQPPRRAEGLSYESLGPGLYEDETALDLGEGVQVAVSVERHWQENGSGIGFHGYARHIKEDGQTHQAPNGAHVEAAYSYHADPLTLQQFGEDAIATEVARMMIGEEPTLFRDVPVDDGEPLKVPLLDVPEAVKLNANIRHQVKAVAATKSSALNL